MNKKLYIHTIGGELYSVTPVSDSPYDDTIARLKSSIWSEFDRRKNLFFSFSTSYGEYEGVKICELNTLSCPSSLLLNLNNLTSIELVEEEKRKGING